MITFESKSKFRHSPYILDLIFLVMTCYVIVMTNISAHEEAHAQTCKYFGGEPTVTLNYLKMSGETKCKNGQYQLEQAKLDSMNEIIGYNTVSVIFAIFIIAISILIAIWGRDWNIYS